MSADTLRKAGNVDNKQFYKMAQQQGWHFRSKKMGVSQQFPARLRVTVEARRLRAIGKPKDGQYGGSVVRFYDIDAVGLSKIGDLTFDFQIEW